MFMLYMVIAALLLVNMLIAMMGTTYQAIAERKNEWIRQVILLLKASNNYLDIWLNETSTKIHFKKRIPNRMINNTTVLPIGLFYSYSCNKLYKHYWLEILMKLHLWWNYKNVTDKISSKSLKNCGRLHSGKSCRLRKFCFPLSTIRRKRRKMSSDKIFSFALSLSLFCSFLTFLSLFSFRYFSLSLEFFLSFCLFLSSLFVSRSLFLTFPPLFIFSLSLSPSN